METPKRNARSIAMEKNGRKPAGEPKFDPNTGAPCPQDHCKGSYKPTRSPGTPTAGAADKAGGEGGGP